jgi:tRNA threonylcarbamoyladenosine biosynthesis protein TsaB
MIVLGIDTSDYANAVGVVNGDQVLADFNFEAGSDSLEKIVTNIDFALQSAGLTLDDVHGIGVGLGPGSWTGIRVGVTVGKILAFSASKPVVGVPTLEVLAYIARNEESIICPVISAGARDTVYAACYRIQDGNVIRAGEYYVGDLQGLTKMITEPAVMVGPRAKSYCEIISRASGSSTVSIRAVEAVPCGGAVARLAEIRLEQGESDDVLSLTPLYLKESTARAFLSRYAGKAQVRG